MSSVKLTVPFLQETNQLRPRHRHPVGPLASFICFYIQTKIFLKFAALIFLFRLRGAVEDPQVGVSDGNTCFSLLDVHLCAWISLRT